MKQSIVHVAVVVNDYDEAIEFYTQKLGFELLEDIYIAEQDKRWDLVEHKTDSRFSQHQVVEVLCSG